MRGKPSTYRGVRWDPKREVWHARIVLPPHRLIHIGSFSDEERAAVARDRVVLYLRGSKAVLNFPDRGLEPASLEEVRAEAREANRNALTRTGRPEQRLSRYLGVRQRPSGRWAARITMIDHELYVGVYDTERTAAIARDRAILALGLDLPLQCPAQAKRLGPAKPEALRREARIDRRAKAVADTSHPEASRYVGVSFREWDTSFPFLANLSLATGPVYLGSWRTAREAAIARDRAVLALAIGGDDPFLNFPDVARRRGPATPEALRDEARSLFKATRTSRFRGVSWVARVRRWSASIHHDGKQRWLGHFDDEEVAAQAYDAAAKRFKGKRARLNFPG